MKMLSLLLVMVCVPWSHLYAQISVEVVLNQEHFLIGESLPAAVRIANRSGQTLTLGDTPDWLTFSVESREGGVVVKNSEVPVEGEFKLESGQVATRRVDLASHFSLNQIGRYSIVATVRLKQWNTEAITKPKPFDIIHGAKIWSQDFGVPETEVGKFNRPEVRRYALEQANYLRSELRLYLRLTDATGDRVLKVFPLGPMVSFGSPEHQIDKESQLHVLYQNGARSYSYAVISPDGDTLIRQTYDIASSRPRLQLNEQGQVVVAGGARRIAASDLPAVKSDETDGPAEAP
jgi:hypothetical protein